MTEAPSSLPWRSWRAASRALFAACSPLDLGETCADLLERERVVADELPVSLDEGERALGRLAVALDRRRLPAALDPVVLDRDVDDVRPVL